MCVCWGICSLKLDDVGECRATCGQACIMRTTILSPGCGLPLQINTKETRKSMQRQVAGNYVPAAWSFILETLVLFLLILSATLLFDRKQKNTQLRVFSTHFSSMVTSLCLEFLCFMDPSFECICLLRSQRTFPPIWLALSFFTIYQPTIWLTHFVTDCWRLVWLEWRLKELRVRSVLCGLVRKNV